MLKNILSISVVKYAGKDGKLFDYFDDETNETIIGQIVKITFGDKKTFGVVMAVNDSHNDRIANKSELLEIEGHITNRPLPKHLLELASWMMDYYAASAAAVWRTILPSGLLQKPRLKAPDTGTPPVHHKVQLNPAQQKAYETILRGEYSGYLLYGITGSGKTEVYIELIRHTLAAGKSAIVLVPEIALTPQMIERLSLHFQDTLVVSHSKLTPARRKSIWHETLSSDLPRVYLGPRSALFLPINNLGMIIVDEEHEASYKQDNAPTYQVNSVVAQLSRFTQSPFVLGSATPSLYARHAAEAGRIGLIRLNDRAIGARLPSVEIIKLNPGTSLSPQLVNMMRATIKSGKQIILFLNRRGSASAMLCESCGHIETCPRCDTSLTFHADLARLLCHFCGFKKLPPTSCPDCHHNTMHFIGTGTKRIEQEVSSLFPTSTVCRLDSDNATLDYVTTVYEQLRSGEIDIVIGTQMIARGLDLPNVTTVGVVLAESMLAIPDFSSSERTFDLLTQVAGRAGRGDHAGNVIIQTHSPNHPAVVAASQHDYDAFYQWEIKNRKTHAYPPFVYLVKLVYGHRNATKAAAEAARLAGEIRSNYPRITVLGPIERTAKRTAGQYQQQIIVKSLQRQTLVEIARHTKQGWKYDLDPINLL